MHAKLFTADLGGDNGRWASTVLATLVAAFTCPALSGTATLTVSTFPSAPTANVFVSGDAVVVQNYSRTGGGIAWFLRGLV